MARPLKVRKTANGDRDEKEIMSVSLPRWIVSRVKRQVEKDKAEFLKEPEPGAEPPTVSSYVYDGLHRLIEDGEL
ncbi:MAG TPA: hypothetical protein VGG32_00750 [Thermoplasmata archaeon]|jgi:hypothetical protein